MGVIKLAWYFLFLKFWRKRPWIKEDNAQNLPPLPPIFSCAIESPLKIWTNKKKTSKNINFWWSYGSSKFTIFRPSEKRYDMTIWRHWSTKLKMSNTVLIYQQLHAGGRVRVPSVGTQQQLVPRVGWLILPITLGLRVLTVIGQNS